MRIEDLSPQDLLLTSEPQTILVDPLIHGGDFGMIYAGTGVGKTWLCFCFACYIAAGKSFLQWKATGEYKVVYLEGEMGKTKMASRMMAMAEIQTSKAPGRRTCALSALTLFQIGLYQT